MDITLLTDLLETHLRPCHVLNSQGSMFPVESEYLKRETVDEPPWEVAADSFAQARTTGDVLIFNARRPTKSGAQFRKSNDPISNLSGTEDRRLDHCRRKPRPEGADD